MQYLTLSLANRFSFTCPIFNAKVEMRSCAHLRDKVYRAERVESRRGCQACISSSKCPAAELVKQIAFRLSGATDHCSSLEEKEGRLPAEVLERIAPITVLNSTLDQYSVPLNERQLIETSRERIEKQIAGAPRDKTAPRRVPAPQMPAESAKKRAQRVEPASTPETTKLSKAAASGDLTAAINAE